jgi:prepilin-type N-terminal cleavage/methylation domain-containing protein
MRRMIERARQEEGFTLIELMIVIVILGILAGIVLFAVGGITDRGTSAACKTDQSTISTAVQAYVAKHGTNPNDLVPTLTDPAGGDQFLKWDDSFVKAGNVATTGPTDGPAMQRNGVGYVILYDQASGDVWAAGSGTPDATTSCP